MVEQVDIVKVALLRVKDFYLVDIASVQINMLLVVNLIVNNAIGVATCAMIQSVAIIVCQLIIDMLIFQDFVSARADFRKI